MDCPICTDKLIDKEKTYLTKCNHSYHNKCIYDWVFTNKKDCPMCRKDLDIDNILSLFHDISDLKLIKQEIKLNSLKIEKQNEDDDLIKKTKKPKIYSFEHKSSNHFILIEKHLDELLENGEEFETLGNGLITALKFKGKEVLFQTPTVRCIKDDNYLRVFPSEVQFDTYIGKIKKLINYEDLHFSKNFRIKGNESIFKISLLKPTKTNILPNQFEAKLIIETRIVNKDNKKLIHNKLIQIAFEEPKCSVLEKYNLIFSD